MWCHNCGQDVPGTASPETGKLCCQRCGGLLDPAIAAPRSGCAPADTTEVASGERGRMPVYDGWELEEQLRHIGRLLSDMPMLPAAPPGVTRRVDRAHGRLPERHRRGRRTSRRKKSTAWAEALAISVPQALLLVAVAALVCGGALLGWSWYSGSDDLWPVGVPIALGGAVGLLIVFLLQMDTLDAVHRQTAAKLDKVDGQLDRLCTVAVTNAVHDKAHAPTAKSGAHSNENAASGLLGELRGQLDSLAARLDSTHGSDG